MKVCILSKGGGGGQTPNPNFFGCHFGNNENFITLHLDTKNFPSQWKLTKHKDKYEVFKFKG